MMREAQIRKLLEIPYSRLDQINQVLLDENMEVINQFLEVVARYGSPDEINLKAEQARQLPVLLGKVKKITTFQEIIFSFRGHCSDCNFSFILLF